jgi:Double zinc ribbon
VWVILQPLLLPGRTRPPAYEPPDLEDTPKGMALAALKEIEFDRETGKLSDEDYAFLKAKYTGAALEALRAEAPEAAPGKDVETMIAARVRALRSAATSAPAGAPSCSVCGPRPEADAVFCSNCGQRLREGGPCADCGAPLTAGSRFCAQCGAGVAA